MNPKFKINIQTVDRSYGYNEINKEITLEQINRFSNLIKAINRNVHGYEVNWFQKIPETYNKLHNVYSTDVFKIYLHMEHCFDYELEDLQIFKEFFRLYTPNGCDGILGIKIFKVEEINL